MEGGKTKGKTWTDSETYFFRQILASTHTRASHAIIKHREQQPA